MTWSLLKSDPARDLANPKGIELVVIQTSNTVNVYNPVEIKLQNKLLDLQFDLQLQSRLFIFDNREVNDLKHGQLCGH